MAGNSYFSEEFNNKVFENLTQFYFDPEISQRKENGLLNDDFVLQHAQALIFADNRKTIVRLNSEVVAKVKVKDEIDHTQPDFNPNCGDVEKIEIAEDEFLDCGHITMITFKDGRLLKFDFAYNKKKCKKLINNAAEFLSTAKLALQDEHLNASIDNAFSSIELLAKAQLLMEANKKIDPASKHKGIHSGLNLRYKNSLSETEREFRKWFNKLSSERRNARYLDNSVSLSKEDLTTAINSIDEFHADLSRRI